MNRFWLATGVIAALAAGSTIAAERSSTRMAGAAVRFLDSLSPEQRQKAVFPFDGAERFHWHFIPTETFRRNGLTIKEMSEAQRRLAHELLKSGLSQRGYITATQIMDLETVLGALEAAQRAAAPQPARGQALVRDPERYFLSVFGAPSSQAHAAPWGWRVEGHHISLHFTVVDGTIAAGAPSFFGTNPAEVREGPKKGTRILGIEEETARAFMAALDMNQRDTAFISAEAPGDMITMANVKIDPLSPTGISASALNANQKALLMKVIDVYTGFMADDIAADRVARYKKAGEDKIAFAWAGSLDKGAKHYYRIQGPTFLIEYDNTQNDANHIHSIWRDFDRDFGRDLLREHLKSVAH
jgi:hypothetical protein